MDIYQRRPHLEPKPSVASRFRQEFRDATLPPTSYGEMERYQAFLPGRNTGQRCVDNAPVGTRGFALVLDLIIYTIALVTLVVVASLSWSAMAWLLLAGYPLGFFLTQTLLDAAGGSLGKRMLGLRVEGPAHTPVDLVQSARRNTWLLLPLIPIAGPVVACGVALWLAGSAKADAFGMAAHDRMSRTRVVRRVY